MAVKGNEIEEAADIPEHEALTEPEDTSENIDEENVTGILKITMVMYSMNSLDQNSPYE